MILTGVWIKIPFTRRVAIFTQRAYSAAAKLILDRFAESICVVCKMITGYNFFSFLAHPWLSPVRKPFTLQLRFWNSYWLLTAYEEMR